MSQESQASSSTAISEPPPAYSIHPVAAGVQSAPKKSLFEKISTGSKGQKGIRLLSLLPGCFGSRIQCRMEVASLYKVPEYKALSYTWQEDTGVLAVGDSFSGKDIENLAGVPSGAHAIVHIGGEEFPIQRNLWWALQYLRSSTQERKLWIDAVCIDQMDIEERNHQVGHMGEIYKLAEEVIVWVGREDQHSKRTFGLLREPSFRKCISSLESTLESHGDNNFKAYHASFNIFCERAYWKRLWIVQEIVLASKIQIQCGADSERWEAFTKAGYLFQEEHKLPMKIAQQRIRMRGGSCSLDSLLKDCGQSLCQDPRDKVYGLLGLVAEDQRLEVDYSRPLFEIFADIGKQHNEHNAAESVSFLQHLQQMWPELYEFDNSIRTSPRLLDEFQLKGIVRGRITRFRKADKRSSNSAQHPNVYKQFPQESAVKNFRHMIDTLMQAPPEDLDRIQFMGANMPLLLKPKARVFRNLAPSMFAGDSASIFLEENGQFGLGPSNIQQGDVLCQFYGCDIAAIVRFPPGLIFRNRPLDWSRTAGKPQLIGRAVAAKRSDEERANTQSGLNLPPTFRYSVPEDSEMNRNASISMTISLRELYLLTR